ncbi:F-box family protein [Rhynchospora pubera]|uniref:F-box family protein n=1 Tax=Rhynchospora pubera TaxID=906938 RepID=A0AAV8EJS7_9POAL|nr:F-box family protein [Rhynchospora pubera]
MGTMGDFDLLPEDCFAHVISFTSPRHACILSLLSSSFRSAADSDAIWERFLPSDYASLLSRAVQPVEYASKKELYLRLCDHPLQIDGGKLSFGLEKSTGAKCFMITACKMNMSDFQRESCSSIILQVPTHKYLVALIADRAGLIKLGPK